MLGQLEVEGRAVAWVVVIAASLFAAAFDVQQRRIPNLLCGIVLAAGLLRAGFTGGPWGLGEAALSCLLLALPFIFLFVFAAGGAGDAKFMGAIGAWLGLSHGAAALVCVVLAGGVLGVGLALYRRRGAVLLGNLARMLYMPFLVVSSGGRWRELEGTMLVIGSMQSMPYGVAILAGVCVAAGGIFWWHII